MNKKTEAKCTDSMLTVSFHAANPPLIWRFDLERNHSFTLALQGEEGDWEFGVTSPKGDFYSVVHFVAREDAEDAFAKVEKALGQKSSRGSFGVFGHALLIVAAAALLIVIGVTGFGLYMRYAPSALSEVSQNATPIVPAAPGIVAAPQAQPQPQPPSGMPVPADDVLRLPSLPPQAQ